ncbi:Short-chain dehydrogenase/reductase family 42E member 1, partial [Cucurbita argyrosperma subsp. sororia]
MHFTANQGIQGNTFAVTGALGFVGSALCLDLVRRGALQVRAFDLRPASPWSDDLKIHGVNIIQGDITCKKDVERALGGVDCVFHLAAYGLSGKEMLQVGRIDEVNINGTCHVLDACLEHGVRRLIYMSTYNVVFGGQEIVNGNEGLPYFPIDDHVDAYSRSKSIAEQLVLKTNGRPLKNRDGKCFHTCAIRSCAIYGPGEERHFPRIVSLAKLGLLPFRVGKPSVKTDWIYVDNLVLALILASMGLLDGTPGKGRGPIAAGQPYYVSDGYPVNSFEFVQPLLNSLGYEWPKFYMPVSKALLLGKFFAALYTILYPWLNRWWLPHPLMLPAEIYKVGISNYFSYLKAKEELGYIPMVSSKEGMAATISYWQERKRKSLDGPTIYAWLFSVVGMSMLFSAAFLPDVGPVPFFKAISLFFFRSIQVVRMVFLVALLLHVGESIYAWFLARKVDPANSRGWFWQTFAIGYFSLRFLLRRARSQ